MRYRNYEGDYSEFEDAADFEPIKNPRASQRHFGHRGKVHSRAKKTKTNNDKQERTAIHVVRGLTVESKDILRAAATSLRNQMPSANPTALRGLSYLSPAVAYLLGDSRADGSTRDDYNYSIQRAVQNLEPNHPINAEVGDVAIMKNQGGKRFFVGIGFTGDSRQQFVEERQEVLDATGIENIDTHPLAKTYLPHVCLSHFQLEEDAIEARALLRDSIELPELLELNRVVARKETDFRMREV